MTIQGTARTVHVEHVMGTVVTFDVRDPDASTRHAIHQACAWLHEVDRVYSPYRADSAISRMDRGELLPRDADPEITDVLDACARLKERSGGAFDVRATGRLDPSAYVKGWAAERAAEILQTRGQRHFQINAGGDVAVRGDAQAGTGTGWRIGIRHPDHPDQTAAVVVLHDQAIATSGCYERGGHIVDPATNAPVSDLRSVTVIAADLADADAWSTALYAAGPQRAHLLAVRDDTHVLLIDDDQIAYSDGFPVAATGHS